MVATIRRMGQTKARTIFHVMGTSTTAHAVVPKKPIQIRSTERSFTRRLQHESARHSRIP